MSKRVLSKCSSTLMMMSFFFQGQNVSRLQVELNVEKQQTGQPWRLCLMQIKIKTFHKKYFLLHTVVVVFVI